MHPMVKPALRRSWRTRHSVQFGINPRHAVVLEQVDQATEALLDLLDGTRSLEQVRVEAARFGLGAQRVDGVLALLRRGGVLDDSQGAAPAGHLSKSVQARLRPDLSSLSIVHAAPGAAAAALAGRRHRSVQVRGAGRVGSALASALAAAGVGRVEVMDSGRVEPWDVAPGGVAAGDVGRQRGAAARAAVRRAAPEPPPARQTGAVMDLVVFAPRDGLSAFTPDPELVRPLVRAGLPHLFVGVVEGTGFIGPLVAPSVAGTACGECVSLGRSTADPAWGRILAQLRSGRSGPLPACDSALASAVAGLAAVHVLMVLDGGRPSSLGARVEISLADTGVTVHPVLRHPDCPCADRVTHEGTSDRPRPATARDVRGTMVWH